MWSGRTSLGQYLGVEEIEMVIVPNLFVEWLHITYYVTHRILITSLCCSSASFTPELEEEISFFDSFNTFLLIIRRQ